MVLGIVCVLGLILTNNNGFEEMFNCLGNIFADICTGFLSLFCLTEKHYQPVLRGSHGQGNKKKKRL